MEKLPFLESSQLFTVQEQHLRRRRRLQNVAAEGPETPGGSCRSLPPSRGEGRAGPARARGSACPGLLTAPRYTRKDCG